MSKPAGHIPTRSGHFSLVRQVRLIFLTELQYYSRMKGNGFTVFYFSAHFSSPFAFYIRTGTYTFYACSIVTL